MGPANESRRAPLYQSELSQTPLPEILLTIHRYKVPGVVECRREGEVKRIYFDRGQIIFATTSLVHESLGEMLLRNGMITPAQHEESLERSRKSGKRHGVTLAEMGILTPHQLFVAVRDQIEQILWSVFSWTEGTVVFTPGREMNHEFVKIEISVPYAIVRGVAFLPEAKSLLARIGTKTTLLERVTDDFVTVPLSEAERGLLDQCDGRHTLFELVNTPPLTSSENARLLYAFHVLQWIAVKESRQIKVQVSTEGRTPK